VATDRSGWPDSAEEIEAAEPEPMTAAEIKDATDNIGSAHAESPTVSCTRPVATPTADPLEEDRRCIRQIGVLRNLGVNLGRGRGVTLHFSDGFTNHCVTAMGLVAQRRTYRVVYWDPWSAERGSFLQDGKNLAGVKAMPYGDSGRLWSITEEEFFRVFDSGIVISKPDGNKQ
jgi:hypothetical protein